MSNHCLELLNNGKRANLLLQLAQKIRLPLFLYDLEDHLIASSDGGCFGAEQETPAPDSYKARITHMNMPIGYVASTATGQHIEPVLILAAQNLETSLKLEAEIQDMASEIVHVYDELSTIYSLSRRLGSAIDIDELCQRAIEECRNVLQAETVVIMLMDNKSSALVKMACSGNCGKFVDRLPVQNINGLPDEFFTRTNALLINSIQASPLLKEQHGQSLLCIPLISDDRNIGLIIVTDRTGDGEFRSQDLKQMDAISSEIAVAIKKAQLYEQINRMFIHTVEALASAIDAKDPYTYGHSRRVADYTNIICHELGLSRKDTKAIELASILHDIGKIGTPEIILQKPHQLMPDEFDKIREHPVMGAQILCAIEELKDVIDGIRHHHERYDGNGYPDRFMSTEIPFQARVIAVADSFDAMTSNRPYRKSMNAETAISIMEDCSGSQFDPHIFSAFKSAALRGTLKDIYKSVPVIRWTGMQV